MTAPARSTAPRSAVVVVTHDTRDEVLGCLATLPAAGADEVVVVDTGSRDGTVAAVRAAAPDVVVVPLDNVGFGRAANAGVRRTTADVVVVSNADVRFDAGCVRRLAAGLAADDTLAAVGPAVRYPDGRHQASARQVPDLVTAVGHGLLSRPWPDNPWTRRYRRLDVPADQARDADWLSACALAVRRRAFEDIGGFDPGYFLYVEDVDLGVRLRRAGWRLRYDPHAGVMHRVGASTSRRRAWAVATHARSLDRFYARHVGVGPVGRTLRPVLRAALAGWVAATLIAERCGRRGRSTTGE
jgi:N-acetylglucosaminyl-diphospho-decaprenol L-rhamnosyltransferase